MNEIARNPEYDALISSIQKLEAELSELVYRRDMLLYHTCPMLQTEYMLKIGKIEYAIFEYQCKILRTKRKIELIQVSLNIDQPYNLDEIEKQLDKEYQEYTQKLLEKQKEIEKAKLEKSNHGGFLSEEDSAELKKLYTLIVKKLHPDINPNTTEKQHEQFIDAVNAYKNADLSELRIIYLLLEKISEKETENSIDKLKKRETSLLNEKDHLSNGIKNIEQTFPYSIKDLLQNEEKLQEKVVQLSNQLAECQEQYNDIEKRLQNMIK